MKIGGITLIYVYGIRYPLYCCVQALLNEHYQNVSLPNNMCCFSEFVWKIDDRYP